MVFHAYWIILLSLIFHPVVICILCRIYHPITEYSFSWSNNQNWAFYDQLYFRNKFFTDHYHKIWITWFHQSRLHMVLQVSNWKSPDISLCMEFYQFLVLLFSLQLLLEPVDINLKVFLQETFELIQKLKRLLLKTFQLVGSLIALMPFYFTDHRTHPILKDQILSFSVRIQILVLVPFGNLIRWLTDNCCIQIEYSLFDPEYLNFARL